MEKRSFTIATFIFTIILFCSKSVWAQEEPAPEELKLTIQLRPRSEMRNGLFTPILEGQKPAAFIAQRSRMGLNYSKDEKLKIGLSAQVVTTWGNDPQVQATANNVSLFEAWAQYYFTPRWNIKLGRQVWSYDDERIFGVSNWSNAARKHDAALLGFEKNKFKADLGFAYNQNSEKVTSRFYDDLFSQPYKGMQFLWMKYQLNDAIALSALALKLDLQNRTDSSISHLATFGGNAYYKHGKWNGMATYYYQTGNEPQGNAGPIKTNAWMAAAKIDYHFTAKISAGAGTDYLSGRDMNSTSSRITYFSPLFASNHGFYGLMDYFYSSSPHKNTGLSDSYLNAGFSLARNGNWQVVVHHFRAAGRVVSYSGVKADASLGNEVDLTINYPLMKGVSFMGGYSQMFAENSMRYVKNIPSGRSVKPVQNWVWVSFNFNPEIILLKHLTLPEEAM